MIEFRNINANESGLSVRAKLNRMLSDLIGGTEGVNKLWKRLIEVNNSVKDNANEMSDLKDELQDRLSDVIGYTDREINDLLSYINGMDGGVNGFAEDTNFKPDYPEDVAATVIGVGPGTFTNMLGEDGSPIVVDSVSIVIFFKAAGSTHWKYKTILPTVVKNEVTDEFGDSTSKVITQKFFTEQVKGVAGGSIDITDMTSLDSYGEDSKSGLYALKKGDSYVGNLLVSGNLEDSIVYQFAFGGFNIENGNLVSGTQGVIAYRFKNVSSVTSDTGIGSWSSWKFVLDDFFQVFSEDEYTSMRDLGKLKSNVFYFLYEEE